MATCLQSSLWVTDAWAQGDPLALQKSAIQRIENLISHYRKTGDYQPRHPDLATAETELAQSNRMLSARGDWSALSLGLIKKGTVYRMQSRWTEAIATYQQAHEAAKKAKHVNYQADALAWLALTEHSSRNFGQAFTDATLAVRIAEGGDDKDVLARALDILGTVQISQNDLAGAADTLNREVAVAAQAKDPIDPYFAYLNRADVFLKSGERCDFQREFEPCYEALDHARADLTQALSIAQKLGYGGLAHQTEEFIGNVEARRVLVKSQERTHQTMQKGEFHPKVPGNVLVSQNFVAPPGPVPPQLIEMYRQSKRLAQQAGGFADIVAVRSLFEEGLMNEMQGNNDAALSNFLKSVAVLDQDRRALRDERSRGAYLEDRIGMYYAPVLQLLERQRYAEAFELFEHSRSRALADLLASRTLGLGRAAEQKLYAQSSALQTRIADAQGKLFELASQTDAAKSAAQMSTLQSQIRTLEAEYQKVAARMATEAPRLQNLIKSAPVSLKALQQSMRDEHYELLQYLVLEHAVIVWHVTSESVFVRNVFLPRSQVISKVAALQKSLAERNTPFDETTSKELFLYLVQPVLDRIHSDRLVIIAHEDLNYVPFQVFQNPADGRYLGERFQISYAPSASVLLGLKRSRNLAGGRLLAVADPGIPAAIPEVQTIAKLFPGRSKVLLDELVRETELKTMVADFDVIHLAVHGKFDGAEPMLSYLALARSPPDDGRLTAAEMFGLPLERSRLLVLSACETGRSEATHGNEILGMVRALIYAGAESLVLSNWKVDSAATSQWMQSFYENALTRSIPEAARAALVKVKSNPATSHPYYWAAFTVVGR